MDMAQDLLVLRLAGVCSWSRVVLWSSPATLPKRHGKSVGARGESQVIRGRFYALAPGAVTRRGRD